MYVWKGFSCVAKAIGYRVDEIKYVTAMKYCTKCYSLKWVQLDTKVLLMNQYDKMLPSVPFNPAIIGVFAKRCHWITMIRS